MVQLDDSHSATPLLCLGFVPFIGQEMGQGAQKKRPEFSPFRVCPREAILFQKMREKALRQILRGVCIMTATADIRVERIPISAAQGLQCPWRARLGIMGRREHDAPMRCHKPLVLSRRVTLLFGIRHRAMP